MKAIRESGVAGQNSDDNESPKAVPHTFDGITPEQCDKNAAAPANMAPVKVESTHSSSLVPHVYETGTQS